MREYQFLNLVVLSFGSAAGFFLTALLLSNWQQVIANHPPYWMGVFTGILLLTLGIFCLRLLFAIKV